MKKILLFCLLLALCCSFNPGLAWAHFGLVAPSKSTITSKQEAKIAVDFAFLHPFERNGMDLEVEKAEVFGNGKSQNLLPSLKEKQLLGKRAFSLDWKAMRPGVYTFVMTPKPYFEAAEDKFIIHYTKSVVAAFGEEEGWEKPVGLPVEIVPLTRPFASYTGVFRGVVLHEGKPVAGVPVEVEYLNKSSGSYKAPSDYHVTQVVMTDKNGIFCANVPFGGFWGFAALVDASYQLDFKGEKKGVELGGVLWVRFSNPAKEK